MRFLSRTLFQTAGHVARATVFPTDLVDSKRRFVLIYAVRLVFLVGKRLWQDNCPRQAGALAYQTMLSLVPLLAVSVSVMSWLNLVEYQDQLNKIAASYLVPNAADAVGKYIIDSATGVRIRALGIAGGIGLIALAVTLLLTIERAVNEIFRCNKARPMWRRILTALVLLIVGPAALALSAYFTGQVLVLPGFLRVLQPLAVSVPTLLICYTMIPQTRIQLKFSLPAAVIASILLEALKLGFAFYVRHLGANLSYIYGTFAILPLAMIWIYVSWLIFLFGAEISASLHEVAHHGRFEM
jgi:membrane protein